MMLVAPADDDRSLVVELRQTLARLELALSQISDGLVITDVQGRIVWCNGGFEALIDRPRLFVLGAVLADLLPSLLPAEKRIDLVRSMCRHPSGGKQTVV